jgi:hypothetical protein
MVMTNMMRGMIMAGVDMGYMMMKKKIWITRLVLWNVVIVGIAITEANAWLIVFSSTIQCPRCPSRRPQMDYSPPRTERIARRQRRFDFHSGCSYRGAKLWARPNSIPSDGKD